MNFKQVSKSECELMDLGHNIHKLKIFKLD